MPEFDLKGIKIGKYTNTGGLVQYDDPIDVGDAMKANLELRFAEGRLYAEGDLAEYIKKATGGTISLGAKYIKNDAQVLMYGATLSTRTVNSNVSVAGLKMTAKDSAKEVGVAFYAPAQIDGAEKYTCVFVPRAKFSQPGYAYQTNGESITFNTPTTTGEFLPVKNAAKDLLEIAVAPTEADAIAWCEAVFASQYDAHLTSLTIGVKALTPAFDKATYAYTCATTDATDVITAVAADASATIAITNGETPVTNGAAATWEAGENVLTVTVTKETEMKTYVVTVTKS